MPREDIPIIEPYNPLDKRNLGASVAAAMLASPVHTLPPEPFIGAGVYAIYYRGDFAPYKRLVDLIKRGTMFRFMLEKLYQQARERVVLV